MSESWEGIVTRLRVLQLRLLKIAWLNDKMGRRIKKIDQITLIVLYVLGGISIIINIIGTALRDLDAKWYTISSSCVVGIMAYGYKLREDKDPKRLVDSHYNIRNDSKIIWENIEDTLSLQINDRGDPTYYMNLKSASVNALELRNRSMYIDPVIQDKWDEEILRRGIISHDILSRFKNISEMIDPNMKINIKSDDSKNKLDEKSDDSKIYNETSNEKINGEIQMSNLITHNPNIQMSYMLSRLQEHTEEHN
jgi:hypothetical protein